MTDSEKYAINQYFDGMIEGVQLFAHWQDGVQYVGTCGKTLEQAIKDIEIKRAKTLSSYSR